MNRILIVDPDSKRGASLVDLLGRGGLVAAHAEVLPADRLSTVDLVVVRGHANRSNVFNVCRRAAVPLIVVAAHGAVRDAVAAMKAGAANYLVDPIEPQELIGAIQGELGARVRADQARSAARASMVGDSASMHALLARIDAVAAAEGAVLVRGEPGTGKALAARAIHDASERRQAAFVTINCAVVPAELIEAELFGDGRAAHSDARRGLVDTAQGGSLLLDEVSQLPKVAQARLVDVFLERADTERPRMIATSQHDLERLADDGAFSATLLAQMHQNLVELPPLRERLEDLPLLADHLLTRICTRLARPEPVLAADALRFMASYQWPGNVRELENVLERAVILATDEAIGPELLAINAGAPARPPAAVVEEEATTLEDYFVRFVLDHEDELTETELAAKLGISRKSLWERRQRLNIPRRTTRKRGPRR